MADGRNDFLYRFLEQRGCRSLLLKLLLSLSTVLWRGWEGLSMIVRSFNTILSLTTSSKSSEERAPSYLEELVTPYHPNRPLHSQNACLLVVPRVSGLECRAFSYQAPLLWNQLPVQSLLYLSSPFSSLYPADHQQEGLPK
ncbi:hypothetical protein D4764_13G0012180 [Takifugu flavidus]|uniref:Uncharacterized protein n=1 Tax=Takifugu flavidus TaxID=433684 RepID=A0A5C6PBF3_9TELE|nr:hypothetical protein D4764_13G0012180 [Takifugu flavidus]